MENIILDIRKRMNTHPDAIRKLLVSFDAPATLSISNIKKVAEKHPRFLVDFYNITTTSTSNASGWSNWVAAAGGALSGLASGYSSANNDALNRSLEEQRLIQNAELAKAKASTQRTTLIIVGGVVIVGVLVAIYYMSNKK